MTFCITFRKFCERLLVEKNGFCSCTSQNKTFWPPTANQATHARNEESQKVITVSGSPTAGTSLPCCIPEGKHAGARWRGGSPPPLLPLLPWPAPWAHRASWIYAWTEEVRTCPHCPKDKFDHWSLTWLAGKNTEKPVWFSIEIIQKMSKKVVIWFNLIAFFPRH